MAYHFTPDEAIYDNYYVGKGTPAECEFFVIAMKELNCDVDKILKKYPLCSPAEKQMFENVRLIQKGQTKGFKQYLKRFRLEYEFLNSAISTMRNDWYWQKGGITFSSKASALKCYEKLKAETETDYFGEKYLKNKNIKLIDGKTEKEIKLV